MSVIIKDMDMPVDCLACRISCKHESYLVTGRPEDCPLEEAKTGDLISRADAMAYPLSWEHYDKENGSREFICGVESYREYIEALPSAEAVQGEWVLSDNPNILYECSNCGHGFPHKRNGKSTVFYFQNFCPNCGAKMKGGGSE